MIKHCISSDWLLSVNKGDYIAIDLPNDFAIAQSRTTDARGGAANGFFNGGIGEYVKYMQLESGRHYVLDIDGAYMCAQVDINGQRVAMHPHGYAPFLVDITSNVRPNALNKIKITTNDMQPSTRWYSGAGIYRDVFLWTGGDVRIQPWDIFVKTISADNEWAKVAVTYNVISDIDTTVCIHAEIGNGVAAKTVTLDVKAGKTVETQLFFDIEAPKLWDTENPTLYTLNTSILSEDNEFFDTATTKFGIRTINFDTTHGFSLNGQSTKLKGGCIHHDHGGLGAISLPAAEERKILKLKSAGYNAIRSAHNPPSLALLEACDRLGMLVMDEAFDMWNMEKRSTDYHLWFADWCKRDISYMVKRDRNHPCVISYSIGNEILERDGSSCGYEWATMLADEIRKYDITRPVTSAVCGLWDRFEKCDPPEYREYIKNKYGSQADGSNDDKWAELTAPYFDALDIHGYNYLWDRVESDAKLYPDRIFWHSESHALRFYDSWNTVMRNSNFIGDFTWTAYDNLGEAGTGRSAWARDGFIPGISLAEYPWRTCYQGDFDLCGFRRPQSYFREAVWKGNTPPRIFTTHPEHTGEGFSGTGWHWYDVHESWNFDEKYIGKPVKCETYTDAELIEWYLNGNKVAQSIPEKAIASALIIYAPGELTAVAYKNGAECSRYTLKTTGKAVQIKVEAEKDRLVSDGRDIAFFPISILDASGNLVTHEAHELRCAVSGGELLCLYSGDPCNEDDYPSKICHTFEGHALAAVRTKNAGEVTLTVYSDTLSSDTVTVTAKKRFSRRYMGDEEKQG